MQGKILGGRYQITSHLGGGGFGTTFLAIDKHLPGHPQCVVKQLKPQTATNPFALEAARRLFNREAEVLYQLGSHPQIPRLFAHFEEEEEFYLVQEFIEGHELRREVTVGKQLTETQVILLIREILEILGFVHQQNVIHRDIKPANIIRRKLDGKLVLIDFGAVKQFSNQVINSEGQTSLTIAVGSLGYMPNEQMAGKPRFCSDIYAVGVIGIQALTGINPRQLPEDLRTSEIVWRNLVEVSSEFADVLDLMVRYDFRQRYQSASEALSALNGVPLIPLSPASKVIITTENTDISAVPTETFLSDNLSSECGINYTKLRDLLATGKWREADEETVNIMLKVGDIDQQGWLRVEQINQFSCTDLQTIDQLWNKYSNGRFGFLAQMNIRQNIEGDNDEDYNIWCQFSDAVGWRGNGNYLFWNDLSFTLDAPVGHLPWHYRRELNYGRLIFSIGSRLRECTNYSQNFSNVTTKKVITGANTPEDLYDQGNKLYDKQKYQEAIAVYEKVISLSQAKTIIVNADNINSEGRKDDEQNRQASVKTKIQIAEGDITKQKVDAIVNATDLWFSGSGGVDRTIHRAAGPQLRDECNHLIGKDWETGKARITNGYNLPARWIIHTVGLIWEGGNKGEDQKLAECYQNCLSLAEQYSIKTIAFPAISTGTFRFSIELASKIAVREVKFFLEQNTSIEKVIFVCFGKMAYDCYLNAMKEMV